MIAIIDYEMGNVKSVANAFELLNETVKITKDPKDLVSAEAIVLPGVGAFSDGLNNLKKINMLKSLETEILERKKPYLGICLGLEFLADKSFENGIHDGFGWIKGTVVKLQPNNPKLKIPHMGWNETKILKQGGMLKELKNPDFYYLHSFYFQVDEKEKEFVTSVCTYGNTQITATIQKDNIYAVQFHPEKSQSTGIKLLKNFLDDIRE